MQRIELPEHLAHDHLDAANANRQNVALGELSDGRDGGAHGPSPVVRASEYEKAKTVSQDGFFCHTRVS